MPLPEGFQLSPLQLSLGGLGFNVVDGAGVQWRCATITGWDSPDVKATLTDRQQDHGSWWSPVYLGSRPITMTGTIVAPAPDALDAAIEQLLAAASLDDTVLTVYETIPKQATVRRSGQPVVQRSGDVAATWSLLVTAADPRRYDITEQSGTAGLPIVTGGLTAPVTVAATVVSGDINALNSGSFETRPILTITGSVHRPQVVAQYEDGSTATLSYSGDLQSGDVLVLDCDAHTVILNGSASRRPYLTGQWPIIPAGQSVDFSFRAGAYDPTALLTATWRSAWI